MRTTVEQERLRKRHEIVATLVGGSRWAYPGQTGTPIDVVFVTDAEFDQWAAAVLDWESAPSDAAREVAHRELAHFERRLGIETSRRAGEELQARCERLLFDQAKQDLMMRVIQRTAEQLQAGEVTLAGGAVALLAAVEALLSPAAVGSTDG